MQKVSRKGYKRGVLVQEGGGGSCIGKGVPVGFLGQVLVRKGGVSCAGRGVNVAHLWHFLYIFCPHNFWQVFILNVMQKAVANLVANLVRMTSY